MNTATTGYGISVATSGRVEVDGAEITMSGEYGVYGASGGGKNIWRNVQCLGAGFGFVLPSGTHYLESCTVSGPTYGVYVDGGTVSIGPNCSFDGAANPVTIASGTCTMCQTGGVASFAGGVGTTKMTFAQHYALSIEIGSTTPISAGAQTINPLASFIGQEFTVVNNNTGASTTTVFGIIVPVAARYLIRCNAAGVWEHDVVT